MKFRWYGAALLTAALLGCFEPVLQTASVVTTADELAERLITAEPGAVIELAAGLIPVSRSLSLNVSGVTVRGAGMDATVLDFTAQLQGAEGLLVSASDFTIESLTLRNTKGDALKINQGKNVVVRSVRAEWTGGPLSTNGAYGIYPVQCENVLIEDSHVEGASDAGIYVGQSSNIVVRGNTAQFNVAGIEIENSTHADVYDNSVVNNTGGILVFDLPDLPVQGGNATRVFRNKVEGNNTENFAPEGNIVGTVPAGTGVMINSNDRIEVFDNDIGNHRSANVLVVSYLVTGREIKDPNYDAFPEGVYIHRNRFGRGGWQPDTPSLTAVHKALGGKDLPHVLWDGIVNPAKLVDGQLPETLRVCIGNEGEPSFANLDAANAFARATTDPTGHQCVLPPLPAVVLH